MGSFSQSVGFQSRRKQQRFLTMFEQLETRRLFSTLDISGGALSYTADSSNDSDMTISVDSSDHSIATIADPDQSITLTSGATLAGWSGSGTSTVTGPISSYASAQMFVGGNTTQGQSFTIDYSNGDPVPASGAMFTPTPGLTGNNGLTLQTGVGGTTFLSEIYGPTSFGAGTIIYSDSANSSVPITFSNLSAAIDDTVPSPTMIFDAPAVANTVNIVNGPTVGGAQTDEINDGGTGAFSPIDFGNKVTATANINNADATTVLDVTTTATGLTALYVNSSAGSDAIDAEAIPSSISATADTGSSSGSTIVVGLNGVVSGIQGTLYAQSTGGSNSLLINDSSDTTNAAATIGSGSPDSLTGLSTGTIVWDGSSISSVTIDGGTSGGGAAGVTFDVIRDNSANTYIVGGPEQNTFNLGSHTVSGGLGNLSGTINITGGSRHTDILTLDDSDNTFAESYIVNGPIIQRDGHNVVDFSIISTVNLNTSIGDGSFVAVVADSEEVNINLDNDIHGNDQVSIGAVSGGGDMANIQGPVSLTDSSGHYDLVFYDDADAMGAVWTLNDNDTSGPKGTASVNVTGSDTVSYRPLDLGSVAFVGGSGGNDFEVSNVTGAASTAIYSGVDSDNVNISATEPNASLIIDGEDGSDTVNLGHNGSMANFGSNSTITVSNDSGNTALTLDDSADATASTVDLNDDGTIGQITGFGGATVVYNDSIIAGLTINGGTGGNTFNVDGTPWNLSTPTTQIDKGSGSGNTVNIHGITEDSTLDLTGTGTNDAVNIVAGATISGQLQINEAANSTAMTIDLSADNLPHDLLLTGDGTTTTLTDLLGNMQTLSIPTAVLTTLTIDTSASQDESLTVDFANGIPVPGTLTFNGGADSTSPANSHSMTLEGGSFTSETETLSAPSTGSFAFTDEGGNTHMINYSGLQPITDSVPASIYTLNDTGTDQSFSLTDGAGGTMVFANTPTSSLTPKFESSTFSNKSNVIIDVPNQNGVGLDGLIDAPTIETGLTSLTVNISANGTNQLNVEAVPSGVGTEINGGSAEDDTTVDANGIASGDTLTLVGGAGNNTIIYNANGTNPVVTHAGTPNQVFISLAGFGTVDTTDYQAVNVTDIAPVTITPGTAQALSTIKGSSLTNVIVGTFTLPLPSTIGTAPAGLDASDYTATINWGDSTTSAATIVLDANNPGVYDIVGSHTYAAGGVYTVGSSIAFADGTYTSAVNGVTISVAVPSAGPTTGTPATATVAALSTGTSASINAHTGASFTDSVGSFTDTNPTATPSQFTASINWGDGAAATAGTITQPGGAGTAFLVTGSHTYTHAGSYTITTNITGADGTTTVLTDTATITDAAVTGSVNNFSASAGVSTGNIVLATITDPNPYATVSDLYAFLPANGWGDSTPTTATPLTITEIGATSTDSYFEITGSHTYAAVGSYPMNISVTTSGGVTTALTAGTATVTSNVLTAGATPAISATAKLPTGNVVVSTFTDNSSTATAGNYTAIIDWGDGTPTSIGTINFTAGTNGAPATITVSGNHTYASYGQYTIHVTSTSSDGREVTTTATANVAAPHLFFTTAPTTMTAGQKLNTVTVEAVDANGNIALKDHSTVKLVIHTATAGNAKLLGSVTAHLKNGVAIFSNITIKAAGSYTIEAVDGSYAGAISGSFTVNAAAAKKLKFAATPNDGVSGVTAQTPFVAQVEVLDKYGNIVTTDHSTVSLALGRHPGGAALTGKTSAAATNGTAVFSDLLASTAGVYTLIASDSENLANAVSGKFNVGEVVHPLGG